MERLRGDRSRRPFRDERTHDVRFEQRAAVGDGAHRRHHLQRGDADLVTHGHRRQAAGIESRRIPDNSRALAAEVRRECLAESKAVDVAPEPLRANAEPGLDRADVARLAR